MSINPHPTKGRGWWQIRISRGRNKKQENYAFQGTKAEALAFEAEIRGIPSEQQHQTPVDILGRFLDWYALDRSSNTLTYANNELPKVIKRLGNKHLALYRQADYNRYKQQRAADGVTKRTCNVELATFRSLLRFAADELRIPIGDLPKLYSRKQTAPPDKHPLTPQETRALIDQLTGDKRTIAMLYAYCGLRRDEALTLTRGQVDLDRAVIHIKGKGDKGRIVPIVSDELRQQLTEHCEGKGRAALLFPSPKSKPEDPQPYRNIKKSLISAAKRAGIDKPIYNHLLRHSAATNALIGGVNIRALQMILGHSDVRVTELYTHMAADVLQTEAAKINEIYGVSAMSAIKNEEKANDTE